MASVDLSPATGADGDLTRGPELRAVLGLALPLTAANLMQQGYLLADSLIVGRLVGAHGLAAIGAAQPFSYLVCMTYAGVATGFTVRVARLRGAGTGGPLGPGVIALAGVTLVWSLGSLAVVAWLARPLLELAGVRGPLAEDTRAFLLVLCAGLPALLGLIGLSSWLRGLGVVRAAVGVLVVASLVNVVLAWLLVGPAGLGLTGAALATVLANTVALAGGLAWCRRAGVCRPARADLRAAWPEGVVALRLGAPLAVQHLVVAVGAGLLLAVISPLGEGLLAGVTVVSRVELFTAMVFVDLSGALTVFVAQNHGAGATARIRSALLRTGAVTAAATAVLSAVLVLAAPVIAATFVPDAAVQQVATRYLVITSPFFALLTLAVVGHGYLNGLGRTVVPLACTVLSFGVVRLSLSYVWREPFGVDGVIWAVVAGWVAGAGLTAWAVARELGRRPGSADAGSAGTSFTGSSSTDTSSIGSSSTGTSSTGSSSTSSSSIGSSSTATGPRSAAATATDTTDTRGDVAAHERG